MPLYRFYLISTRGSRSVPQDFDCQSEFAALIHASHLLASHRSVEVWQGERFVGEIGSTFARWPTKTDHGDRSNPST